MTPSTAKIPYRADIDGLRAIAVLSVVLFHADLGLSGGYVGVDVFFVISGFLITSLILKDLRAGKFSLTDFWERRVRRIVPPLVVVMLATLALGWWLMIPTDYRVLGTSMVSVAAMTANFRFWLMTNYFAASADENPVLHTWSLAVEEQFYLILPLVLLGLAFFRRWNWVLPLLLITAVVSFSLSVVGVYKAPSTTFFLLPTRVWELLAGSLLAFLIPNSSVNTQGQTTASRFPVLPAYREAAAVMGLLLIIGPCLFFTKSTLFPGVTAIPPVLGTALIIWAGLGQSADTLPKINRLLTWRPLVFIGLISYSLYLWHWPLLVFARYVSFGPLTLELRVALAIGSFALAILTWLWVETPCRTKKILSTRPQLFLTGAVTYGLMLLLGLMVRVHDGYPSRLSPRAAELAAAATRDRNYVRSLHAADVPSNLTPLGVHNQRPELLVWGDSHAMAILPAVDQLFQNHHRSAQAATHTATPPVVDWYSRQGIGLHEKSVAFANAVLDYVEQSQPQGVLLAAAWEGYLNQGEAEFREALFATVQQLQARGTTVYFLKDVPTFPRSIPRFMAFYENRGRNLDTLALNLTDYQKLSKKQAALLPELTRRGVQVIDPVSAFLREDAQKIWPFDSQGVYYRDSNHLTSYGAEKLIPVFTASLQPILSQQPSNKNQAHIQVNYETPAVTR